MKIAQKITRGVGSLALALWVAACAAAQEAPTYVRLVDSAKGIYHPSVDKEMFTNRGAQNKRRFLVTNVCAGEEPLDKNQAEFDAWFLKFYFPMLTDPALLTPEIEPTQPDDLSMVRRKLMRDFFGRLKSDQVREHLNKITLAYLSKFVANNLHPAVRYNAMLIIGDLDERGAVLTGGAKPAQPMETARDVMKAELISPTQIDAVRVAALLGLRRHAELNRARPADKQWTEATITGLADKIGSIAAAKKPPAGRSVDGHVWMRRLALETLAELGATRPLPPVTTLVDRIIGDAAEPIELRVAAAKAQGRLKNPLPMGSKPAAAAERIARVGVDALTADLEELKHYVDHLEREELTSGPRTGLEGGRFTGGSGLGILEGGGEGDSSTKPEEVQIIRDPRVASTQRRLKVRLENVRQGLVGEDGAAGLAALGDKAPIDKIAAAVGGIQQTLDKAPTGDPVLLDELKTFYENLAAKGDALEELLPAAAKPATEGPATPDGPVVDGPVADGPVGEVPATDEPAAEPDGTAP